MFSLKEIQAKIKENLRKCYDSGTQAADLNIMRGLSFIKPDQRCSTGRSRNLFQQQQQQQQSNQRDSSDYSQIGDDFCSSADNGLYPIGGQIPALANAIIEFDSEVNSARLHFDSVDAWSDSIATTLLLKSSKRDELRFYHFKGFSEAPVNYRTFDLSKLSANATQPKSTINISNTPLTSLQFEATHPTSNTRQIVTQPNLFVLSSRSNQIFKLKMSACESYKACGECLVSADPYCGWCTTLNECTSQAKCLARDLSDTRLDAASNSQWLNGAQLKLKNGTQSNLIDSMCVDIESVEPAVAYKGGADWIEIKFRKDIQQFSAENATNYQCVFVAPHSDSYEAPIDGVSGSFELRTDAVQVSASKLKCSLPHLTKLQG